MANKYCLGIHLLPCALGLLKQWIIPSIHMNQHCYKQDENKTVDTDESPNLHYADQLDKTGNALSGENLKQISENHFHRTHTSAI